MLQQQSTLLRTPTELRHKIFKYLIPDRLHMRLLSQGYNLSHCLEPCEDGIWKEGSGGCAEVMWQADGPYMRTDISNSFSDPLWARRLQSSWGFHCRCEELATNDSFEGPFRTPLPFVCRKM
jgi:hypothetical protein